jgi:hypothetical protein
LTMIANHRWQAKWCTLESLQSTLLQTHEPEPQHAANPPPLQTMFIVNSNVERLHVRFVMWFTCTWFVVWFTCTWSICTIFVYADWLYN